MLVVSEKTVAGSKINVIDNEKIVLGIVKRRPIKQISDSDLKKYIGMCERVVDATAKDKTADKFADLAYRLSAELKLRETGHKPFVAKGNDRYTIRDIPAKAVTALRVLEKIVKKFEDLETAATGSISPALYLLSFTTKEAVSAFETGRAYGEKTRAAYLPPVFRHLLVQIAKNLKDGGAIPVVQAFTNDAEKIAMLDAAWNSPADTSETKGVAYKVVTDRNIARVHPSERVLGKRAKFHIYYKLEKGERSFGPSFATNVADAVEEAEMIAAAAKAPIRVYAVVVCNPETSL